jgi:hypothetical protein
MRHIAGCSAAQARCWFRAANIPVRAGSTAANVEKGKIRMRAHRGVDVGESVTAMALSMTSTAPESGKLGRSRPKRTAHG